MRRRKPGQLLGPRHELKLLCAHPRRGHVMSAPLAALSAMTRNDRIDGRGELKRDLAAQTAPGTRGLLGRKSGTGVRHSSLWHEGSLQGASS